MPDYLARTIEDELKKMANLYPVITLTGPRQSGKTTVLRHLFPDKPYYNLESPDILQVIQSDPRGFLRENHKGAILDEIQKYPELVSYLQADVDENENTGRFILSGSENLSLSHTVSQTLAGRTAMLLLYPLSIEELRKVTLAFDANDYIYSGFYPRTYKKHMSPTIMYRDYLQTYVERDVRQLSAIKDLSLFQKFLVICAGRIGQMLNYNAVANEVGVSNNTIKQWLSVLEASYVITLLRPYYNNINKRVVKSPKLYFVDVGLASFLLGIHTVQQVKRDPLRGALFENLVVMDLIKMFTHRGKLPSLYYYRDNNQNEVDVLIKTHDDIVPIEIKSSETLHPQFAKGLNYFNKMVGRMPQGYIVYAGSEAISNMQGYRILNYRNLNTLSQIFE